MAYDFIIEAAPGHVSRLAKAAASLEKESQGESRAWVKTPSYFVKFVGLVPCHGPTACGLTPDDV